MLEPLRLFGGIVQIPLYAYRWVMTSAQIDLMTIDIPIVVYKTEKDNNNHTKKEMNDLMTQWEEKRRKSGKSIDFTAGSKANLNDFMRTGMDAFKNTKTL